MNELNTIVEMLSGERGWAAAAVTWIVAFRTALKPFAAKIQSMLTSLLKSVAESPETDDDCAAKRVLSSKWYRITAYFIDYFVSVKLPTSATFDEMTRKP